MTRKGIDYSGKWPSIASMRNAGLTFVVRYVSTGDRGKEITGEEVSFWRAAGVDICIVFETTAGRALAGFTAGAVDATTGRGDVVRVGGPSDGGVIYFAVDVDTTSDAQRAAVVDYLNGAASVIGWDNVGVYAEYEVIEYVLRHSPCRRFWQTYAWSHGAVHEKAALYQYSNGQHVGGVEVDLDEARQDDFGQWFYVKQETLDVTPEQDARLTRIEETLTRVEPLLNKMNTWLGIMTVGDNVDDTKDAGTHPFNLQELARVLAQIKTGVAAEADDESKILGAIAAIHLSLTDDQVNELASHLGVDYNKIRDAVRFNVSWPDVKPTG